MRASSSSSLIVNAVVVVSTCAVIAFVPACPNFDRSDQVKDMRILAVKTDPPEILFSPLFLQPASQRPPQLPLPTTTVNVEVFAFDPRGGHTQTTFQLCPPGVTDSTCRLYDPTADLNASPADARADIEAVLAVQKFSGEISETATPVGRVEPSQFSMTFSPHVMDFLMPKDDQGNPTASIFPIFPRVVFQETNVDQDPATAVKERAFKRIPLTLDLTSPDLPPDVVQNLAQSLGIKLCTSPIPDSEFDKQGRADCLEKRVANTNPTLRGFLFEPDPDPAKMTKGTATIDKITPTVEPGSLLAVAPGTQIAVTPVFSTDSVERYQVVSFDISASKIILLNRVEDLACNWYSTRGNVGNDLTALQFEAGLGTTWTTPSDAKPGERDSLVLVVLDQRGGTAIGEITVEYR